MNILVDYRYRIVCCERTGIYFVGEIVLLQIAQEKEFCGHLARIHHTPGQLNWPRVLNVHAEMQPSVCNKLD